jgi:hemophore-related protein
MMSKLSLTRLAFAVGGLGLSLTAGVGIASADPIVDSTCSYSQFVSALKAENPFMAAAFNAMPESQSGLRQFLAAPKDQRVAMAQQIRSQPANQPYLGVIEQTFSVCNNY